MMKIQIIGLMLLLLGSMGCSDFLKESSQDEVRPSTVQELEAVLLGDVYPQSNYLLTDVLTDDIQCNGVKAVWGDDAPYERYLEDWRELFTWSWQPLMMSSFGVWEDYYKRIMGCNVVMDQLPDVAGTDREKAFLRGQCLTLRAHFYFLLVNYFGAPYNFGAPEQNPGVPLKLESGVRDEYFTRASVAAVYRQIEADLLEGNQLMTENPTPVSVYEMSHLVAKALLSRVYLYMEEWDKAIEYADQLIQAAPRLTSYIDFSTLGGEFQRPPGTGVYDPDESKEIIWSYRGMPVRIFGFSALTEKPIYAASDALMRLYEDKADAVDMRKKSFIYYNDLFGWFPTTPLVMNRAKYEYQSGIRTAEVYLNRAEAYGRKFEESGNDEFREKALADLNELREHRYDTRVAAYKPVSYGDAESLLNFCQEERRRELCFEEYHRWFDLRRYGMPALEHLYIGSGGIQQEFTLRAQSPRYILPIPQVAIDVNPSLSQNPQ